MSEILTIFPIMVISHEHRFIFIKTRKTAGTSMELALSTVCGPRDIITPTKSDDEEIRKQIGGVGPQNYLESRLRYLPADWWALVTGGNRKMRYYNHMPAEAVRARVGRAVWDSYFKFCFDRNPWDKVVSSYFWRVRDLPESDRPTLDQYIESDEPRRRYSDFRKYCIDGTVAMDFVGRYERLDEDWRAILHRLHLSPEIRLPSAKSGYRSDKRPYQELYTDAGRERVAAGFAREIEYFDYRF